MRGGGVTLPMQAVSCVIVGGVVRGIDSIVCTSVLSRLCGFSCSVCRLPVSVTFH